MNSYKHKQDQEGHAQYTIPQTLYYIFSYRTEIYNPLLIMLIIIKNNLTQQHVLV
jgi:hypothetical protein